MSIFDFKSSKTYLEHYMATLPKRGRGEVTRIAEALQVSTSLVSQVFSGEKTFTPEQAQSLNRHLGLSGLEADYLFFLINLERSGTAELKEYWREKIADVRTRALKVADRLKTTKALGEQERTTFYSSPLYSLVRLYTSVGDKGKSLNEIAERFELSRARATEVVKFLVETGLCRQEHDRYFMGTQSTHVEQGSPHMLRHHSNWRVHAIRHCENASADELMYTAPVSLSREDFQKLRESMVQFIKSFLTQVHASPAEELACFNLDFYKIDRP